MTDTELTVENRLLARLLGEVDACFAPGRPWPGHGLGEAYRRRMAYRADGLPWVPGGDTEDDRRRELKALGELARRRLVVVGRKSIKRSTWRLTTRGDATGRALCGLPSLADAVLLIDALRAAVEHGPYAEFCGQVWVPEWHLAGTAPGWAGLEGDGPEAVHSRRMLVWVEEVALPLAVRGVIEVNGDSYGRCWYRIAPGAAMPEPVKVSGVGADDGARATYYTAFEAARRSIESAPYQPEIGWPMVSCSMMIQGGAYTDDESGYTPAWYPKDTA